MFIVMPEMVARSSKSTEDKSAREKMRQMERMRHEKQRQLMHQKELEVRKFAQEQKMEKLERKVRPEHDEACRTSMCFR
jgi:hypothetical protein